MLRSILYLTLVIIPSLHFLPSLSDRWTLCIYLRIFVLVNRFSYIYVQQASVDQQEGTHINVAPQSRSQPTRKIDTI